MELRSRRCPSEQLGGGPDRISVLPDDLLLLILARLGCASAAARTGVLSRRWRGLWPRLRQIVFRDVPFASLEAALGGVSRPPPPVSLIEVRDPDKPLPGHPPSRLRRHQLAAARRSGARAGGARRGSPLALSRLYPRPRPALLPPRCLHRAGHFFHPQRACRRRVPRARDAVLVVPPLPPRFLHPLLPALAHAPAWRLLFPRRRPEPQLGVAAGACGGPRGRRIDKRYQHRCPRAQAIDHVLLILEPQHLRLGTNAGEGLMALLLHRRLYWVWCLATRGGVTTDGRDTRTAPFAAHSFWCQLVNFSW